MPQRTTVLNEDEKLMQREMLRVSFFSFLHSAAMPFADLVDGSFLSTLDANSLGAVGVVRASQVGKWNEWKVTGEVNRREDLTLIFEEFCKQIIQFTLIQDDNILDRISAGRTR